MDIFEKIEHDHKKQRELMNGILNENTSVSERQQLFDEFRVEFRAHAAAEEESFYAPMLENSETTDQSRHSVAEHHDAIELLEELEKLNVSDDEWLSTFKKLADENEHHMEEEESSVFDAVRKEMKDTEIENMLGVFEDRKSQELEHA